MVPASGSCRVAMMRISVDLPAPLGPSRPNIPGAMVSETSSSARVPFWYVLERCSIRRFILEPRGGMGWSTVRRSPDDLQRDEEESAGREDAPGKVGPHDIGRQAGGAALDEVVGAGDDLSFGGIGAAGLAVDVRIPVVPAPDQLDIGGRPQRREAVVAEAAGSSVAGAHHLGAQSQRSGAILRLATGTLAPLRGHCTALNAPRCADLQRVESGDARGDASDRGLLIVLIGVILALAHLVEDAELIIYVTGGDAPARRGADVPDVAERAAAPSFLDEHRSLDRLDLRAAGDALQGKRDDLLADVDTQRRHERDVDGCLLNDARSLIDERTAKDGGIARARRAFRQAE